MEECLGPLLRKLCASSTVMVRYLWLYSVFDIVSSECGSWLGRVQGSFLETLGLEKKTELKSCCKAYILSSISVA